VHAPLQVTDGGDGEGVLPTMLLLAVNPGACLAGVDFGVLKRAKRDAGVDGGLDDLRDRAIGGGLVKGQVSRITAVRGTVTPSSVTAPLAVVRWPKPSQLSMTVRPGASRSTKAI